MNGSSEEMYLPDVKGNTTQYFPLEIEGQIRGLQGMVSDDKECEQILTQLRAAQSALKSLTSLMLKSYLTKCYSEIGQKPNPEELYRKLEKTVVLLTKFIGDRPKMHLCRFQVPIFEAEELGG
jgi:DNA-binding FrmR family transcriptional regulator